MKIQNFEEYLQGQHFKSEPQILDDDLSDAYEDWVVDLDGQEIIDYAEKWGELLLKEFNELTEQIKCQK